MQSLQNLAMTQFYGNTALGWGIAAFCALCIFGILLLVRHLVVRATGAHHHRAPQSTTGQLATAFARSTHMLFIAALALAVFLRLLHLPRGFSHLPSTLITLIVMIQIGLWSSTLCGIWIDRYVVRRASHAPENASAAAIINILSLTVIWSVLVLFTLDNFGVNISGLIAGLGIGGVAIAFALQSVLKDLFASLAIVLDKPFVVGDYIVFGDQMGNVERIGIKTTRVRSLGGEQITISNDTLLSLCIRNYKRMEERRVAFNVLVTFETPIEALEKIPGFITGLVQAFKECRFDRCHVAAIEEYGQRIETVYYVLNSDYAVYMNIQQHINFEIVRYFTAHDIHFAYPARRLIGAGAQDIRGH